MDAARRPRAPQGRANHPRRDGRQRRHRAPDAGDPAGRAVAGIGALGQVRSRAAAPQGPPRARLRRAADVRGGRHRHRAQGDPELQAAAGQLLSHPDQVPRRGAPALRRDALARVHHEGRLLVRRRQGLPAPLVPDHVRRVCAHLLAHGPRVSRRAGGHRRHRRLRVARVPGAGRLGRGRDRLRSRRRLRGQRRARRGARAGGAAPCPCRADAEGADAGQVDVRGRRRVARAAARPHGQVPDDPRAGPGVRCCWCAATTAATK